MTQRIVVRPANQVINVLEAEQSVPVIVQAGPVGPPGSEGPQGEPGLDGPEGPPGADGVDGLTGPAGADGVDGADGADGAQGPQGPQGIQGIQGIQGEIGPSGGGTGHVSYTFNTNTTEPPGVGTMRLNNAVQSSATKAWFSDHDYDNLDVTIGLARIMIGHQIYMQDYDDATKWINFNVIGNAVDKGNYFEVDIAHIGGSAASPLPSQKCEVQALPTALGSGPTMRSIVGTGSGDLTTNVTSFSDLGNLSVAIPAVVGDRLYMQWNGEIFSSSNQAVCASFHVGPTTGDVRGTNTVKTGLANTASGVHFVDWVYTVVAGDIVGGNVTVKARWKTLNTTAITCRNGALGMPRLTVQNWGP